MNSYSNNIAPQPLLRWGCTFSAYVTYLFAKAFKDTVIFIVLVVFHTEQDGEAERLFQFSFRLVMKAKRL